MLTSLCSLPRPSWRLWWVPRLVQPPVPGANGLQCPSLQQHHLLCVMSVSPVSPTPCTACRLVSLETLPLSYCLVSVSYCYSHPISSHRELGSSVAAGGAPAAYRSYGMQRDVEGKGCSQYSPLESWLSPTRATLPWQAGPAPWEERRWFLISRVLAFLLGAQVQAAHSWGHCCVVGAGLKHLHVGTRNKRKPKWDG